MALSTKVLSIDASTLTKIIVDFIRDKTLELHRDGCVIALSGGLDSSTVLGLCVRALGADRVTALFLPECQGGKDAKKFAPFAARHFGIKMRTIDISGICRALGTYDFILTKFPTRMLRKFLVKTFLAGKNKHPFVQAATGELQGESGKTFAGMAQAGLVRAGEASYFSKHRVRLAVTYKYAEERNLLVAGSAHKTEDSVGLFVKYGIDDKYLDVLGNSGDTLDLVLWGLEAGMPDENITRDTGMDLYKVAEIRRLVAATAHMRNHSMAPHFQ